MKTSIRFFSGILLFLVTQMTYAQCAANFTYTVDPANNGNVTFTNTSSGGISPHAEWNFGDGSGVSIMSPGTHTFPYTGTYQVELRYYSDTVGSCMDSITQTISVINNFPASTPCDASFSYSDSLGMIYFTCPSAGFGYVDSISFGDGTTGSLNGLIGHAYPGPGVYYVCHTISNSFISCSDSFCDSVVVTGTPSCYAMFTAVYAGAGMTFYDMSNAGSGCNYLWDFGDGSQSTTVGTESHHYPDGTYYVCLTVSNSATSCTNTYCDTVVVNSAAYPCDASFLLSQDTINVYNYIAYNTSSTGAFYTYNWDFGDGSSSTLPYPSHTYAGSGPYYLCLTVTNGGTCTDTYCDSLTAGLAMWSSISLNVLPTGVNEINAISSFENYPNPFSDQTTIHYNITQDANIELEVMDVLGNRVDLISNEHQQAGEHSIVYSAEKLENGIYLMRLHVNGNNSTKKLILNR